MENEIAFAKKTIPRLISSHSPHPSIEELINPSTSIEKFNEYYRLFGDKLSVSEYVRIWLIYKFKKRTEARNTRDFTLFVMYVARLPGVGDFDKAAHQIDRFFGELDEYEKVLAQEKTAFSRTARKVGEQGGTITSTKVELLQMVFKMHFQTSKDVYTIFDESEVSREVPFISLGGYFKILKDFKPDIRWHRTSLPEVIVFKVYNTRSVPHGGTVDSAEYSNVQLSISLSPPGGVQRPPGGGVPPSLEATISVSSRIDDELRENGLSDRIFSALPTISRLTVTSVSITQVKAEFYVPNFNLERPIFQDVCLNDRQYSGVICVEESEKISREKKRGVYIHYFLPPQSQPVLVNPSDNHITASITDGTLYLSDVKVLAKSTKFKSGDRYIRVLITRALNLGQAEQFRVEFCTFLDHYLSQRKAVVAYYSRALAPYRVKFSDYLECSAHLGEEKRVVGRETFAFKDKFPEIYLPGAERHGCQKIERPEMITEEQLTKIKDPDDSTVRFPFQYETKSQAIYHCPNPERPYIGFKRNKMASADKFPCFPCCYKVKHSEETKIKKCTAEKQSTTGSRVITTDKILRMGETGELPLLIQRFFFTTDPTEVYYRMGSHRSPHSILYALNVALTTSSSFSFVGTATGSGGGKKKSFREWEVGEQLEKTNEDRLELSKLMKSRTAGSISENEAVRIATDSGSYLDPGLFYDVLEDHFQCCIILFKRNRSHPRGVLSTPDYSRFYQKRIMKPERPYLLILEHIGSETDVHSYPQCELIAQRSERRHPDGTIDRNVARLQFWNSRGGHPGDPVIGKLFEAFFNMYIINPVSDVLAYPFTSKATLQGVDFFGKTRFVEFEVSSRSGATEREDKRIQKLCILTDPTPAWNLPSGKCDYHPVEPAVANQFLEAEGVIGSKEMVIIENKLVGYRAIKDRVTFYIPLIPLPVVGLVSTVDVASPPPAVGVEGVVGERTQLQEYNNMRKIARYLREYIVFLFSDYCLALGIQVNRRMDERIIEKYFSARTVIHPEFTYFPTSAVKGEVPRKFSLADSAIMQNGKLILPDEEVKKKLAYALMLAIENNDTEVRLYSKSHPFIRDYYTEVADFRAKQDQIIISGSDTLREWIVNGEVDCAVYSALKMVPDERELGVIARLSSEMEREEFTLQNYQKRRRMRRTKKVVAPTSIEEVRRQDQEKRAKLQAEAMKIHFNSPPFFFQSNHLSLKAAEVGLPLPPGVCLLQPVRSPLEGVYVCGAWRSPGSQGTNIGTTSSAEELQLREKEASTRVYRLITYIDEMNFTIELGGVRLAEPNHETEFNVVRYSKHGATFYFALLPLKKELKNM